MCFHFSLDQRKVDSARVDKEMAQLRKVTRKKDNQIKSLQSDARRRELVLRRRQEEVRLSSTISENFDFCMSYMYKYLQLRVRVCISVYALYHCCTYLQLAALRRQKRFQTGSAKTTAAQLSTSKGGSSGPIVASPSTAPSSALSVLSSSSSTTGSSYSATVVFRQQPSVNSTATAFDRNSNKRKSSVFSSDSARKKWRDLERKVGFVGKGSANFYNDSMWYVV